MRDEEAIREALLKTPDGLKTEVALVGFSQGGMEAQLIADSGKFNVQNMVTYGSPLIIKDNPDIYTTHIEAKADHVVEWLQAENQIARLSANPLGTVIADVTGNDPTGSANRYSYDVGANPHGADGYTKAAAAFDKSAASAEFDSKWNKFFGTVSGTASTDNWHQ